MESPRFGDLWPIAKWIVFAAAVIVMVVSVAYILNWVFKPLEVVDPDRIENLSRDANNRWQALEAQQESIGALQQKANNIILTYGEDRSVWPQGKADEYLQLLQQVTNLTTAFNSACGQYEAMWEDEWRDLPAPDDLPRSCVSLR